MSKQQHTPGPWVSSYMPEECGDYVISGGNGVSVAISIGGTKTEAHNARLIAAAPELLEAAEHCRELLMRYEINRVNGEEIADEAIAKLNAAIARARGES